MLRLIAFVICMLATSIVLAGPIYAPMCLVSGASASSGSYAYPLCPSSSGGVIWYNIGPTIDGQIQDAQNIATLTTSLNNTISTVNGHTTSINSLNSSVSSLTSSLNTTISTVNTNSSNITTLQGNVSTLQTDLGTAQTDITDLETRVAALESATPSGSSSFFGLPDLTPTQVGELSTAIILVFAIAWAHRKAGGTL